MLEWLIALMRLLIVSSGGPGRVVNGKFIFNGCGREKISDQVLKGKMIKRLRLKNKIAWALHKYHFWRKKKSARQSIRVIRRIRTPALSYFKEDFPTPASFDNVYQSWITRNGPMVSGQENCGWLMNTVNLGCI